VDAAKKWNTTDTEKRGFSRKFKFVLPVFFGAGRALLERVNNRL